MEPLYVVPVALHCHARTIFYTSVTNTQLYLIQFKRWTFSKLKMNASFLKIAEKNVKYKIHKSGLHKISQIILVALRTKDRDPAGHQENTSKNKKVVLDS